MGNVKPHVDIYMDVYVIIYTLYHNIYIYVLYCIITYYWSIISLFSWQSKLDNKINFGI